MVSERGSHDHREKQQKSDDDYQTQLSVAGARLVKTHAKLDALSTKTNFE